MKIKIEATNIDVESATELADTFRSLTRPTEDAAEWGLKRLREIEDRFGKFEGRRAKLGRMLRGGEHAERKNSS